VSELEKLRGVVLVMEGDAVAFQYAAGIAERSNGMMCTQDTRVQLASVGKQFTAAAILVLVARGVVSVEDQVDRWIAGCPAAWKR
jgi:CubicO group peptidase (beta-lactamase class C family)